MPFKTDQMWQDGDREICIEIKRNECIPENVGSLKDKETDLERERHNGVNPY